MRGSLMVPAALALVVAIGWACGGDDGSGMGTPDAGGGIDSPTGGGCSGDTECDDGLYCNGAESCVAGTGCVDGTAPCPAGVMCDEDADRCVTDCAEATDADGDGHDSMACGGDDCDDMDPNRYPGNVEVCDAEGHDEDCDPATLGPDGDADGYVSEECCNTQDDGSLACGEDCDDTRSGVNPGAPDGCGGGDEDCDGTIDEEPDSTYYRDQDNDLYGDDADTVTACSLPMGYAARGGDCSDDPVMDPFAPSRNPGETEACNGRDDDCDGTIDDGVSCGCNPAVDTTRTCGLADPSLDGVGECRLGSQMCVAMSGGADWTPCTGAVAPMMETCDTEDDDCDTMVDEGVTVTCWSDADRDGYAPTSATTLTQCPPCPDGYTTTNPATGGADCNDGDATIHPGAAEVCDGVDSNCTGDGSAEDADGDGHTRTSFTGCTGGYPKDDCHDNEARVHGSGGYHGDPYCPVGTCRCDDGTCTAAEPGFGCVRILCTGGGTSPPSWDFNCDGVQTRWPSSSSSCTCRIGFEPCPSGYTYSAGTACGSNVTYWSCGENVCGMCTGSSSRAERLPCR